VVARDAPITFFMGEDIADALVADVSAGSQRALQQIPKFIEFVFKCLGMAFRGFNQDDELGFLSLDRGLLSSRNEFADRLYGLLSLFKQLSVFSFLRHSQ
jgi:hypothetical protein